MVVEKITICEALTALDRGDFSSEELVSALLEVIERRDGELGAYLSVDREDALAQAREADRLRAGGSTGRLLGIPVAIKDILNVKGQTCTCASNMLEGFVSPYDATVIARMRDEGAVFLGRTNMDEFAMGSSTENSANLAFHVIRSNPDTSPPYYRARSSPHKNKRQRPKPPPLKSKSMPIQPLSNSCSDQSFLKLLSS